MSPVLFPSKSPHAAHPIPIARKASASIDGTPISPSLDEASVFASPSASLAAHSKTEVTPSSVPVNGIKFGKKKGMDHRCETCSKV